MPYPPQPYPPVTRSEPSDCVDVHPLLEPDDTVLGTMFVDSPGDVPRDATLAAELAADISMEIGSPTVVQDTSDPTAKNSDWCSVSSSVAEHAYIQPSTSLGVTTVPPMLMESDVPSCVSALDSPMDTEYDGATACSELTTGLGLDYDTTPRASGEWISQLLYTAAFSHLSCSRCASPPVAPSSACSDFSQTSSPGQDISDFCADDLSNQRQNSSIFIEPVPATFARPVSPLPPSSPGFVNDCAMEWSDDVSIPVFPLPSSPVPSSSPPHLFTSSPTRGSLHISPPTSPIPAKNLEAAPSTVCVNPFKRPRSPGAVETCAGDQVDGLGEGPAVKKLKPHNPPQPKRSTHLSQHREHAKLKTPFRSPVTAATKDCPRYKDTAPSSEPDPPSSPAPASDDRAATEGSSPQKPKEDMMVRVRTPRASAQFKSPLSAATGSEAGRMRRVVSASPNVQALQLRLQTLKRAIKIRNDGEGEKLEMLANKWTNVAREVAWEVWSVVKDNVQDVSKLGSGRGGFQDSWGWTGEGAKDGAVNMDRPRGEDEILSEDDEPPVPEDTMSLMLRKMGIDPSSLGWNEEEGEFVDVSC
ncbi:hypothetical protein BJ322DRAFT_161410 [Thelephora terrestris]|uniref:Uncharacterized protein n=1 Tax=Thelephora terrestris TaxID=56493 RepID=A0A9P6H9N9_9AGAM|nr:hypothetical protein BJ322DRAFT_161410 [Thelephora terrestris]